MFLARALSVVKGPGTFSVCFDIDSGEPLIDSPGFVRGLEQSLKAVSKMPADVKTLAPADCRRLMLTGKAAIGDRRSSRAGPISNRSSGPRGFRCRSSACRERGRSTAIAPRRGRNREQGVNDPTLAPFAGLAAGVAKGISRAACRGGLEPGVLPQHRPLRTGLRQDAQERLPRVATGADRRLGSAPICDRMNSSVIGA